MTWVRGHGRQRAVDGTDGPGQGKIRRTVVWTLLVPGTVWACWWVIRLAAQDSFDGYEWVLAANALNGLVATLSLPGREMYSFHRRPEGRGFDSPVSARRVLRGFGPPLVAVLPQLVAGVVGYFTAASATGEAPDASYWGVVPFAYGLGSVMGALLGFVVGLLVLVPLTLVPGAVAGAVRGDARSRFRLWLALLLLALGPWAYCMVTITGEGRSGLFLGLEMLLGLRHPHVDGVLPWARVLSVLVVGLVVLLVVEGTKLEKAAPEAQPGDGA